MQYLMLVLDVRAREPLLDELLHGAGDVRGLVSGHVPRAQLDQDGVALAVLALQVLRPAQALELPVYLIPQNNDIM